jgi:hypothetical protein
MVADEVLAAVAGLLVTTSFPFYLYGAWIMVEAEAPVTWATLVHHLRFILTGLTLNTVPVVVWMVPRLADQLGGLAVLHAFFGLQAYAMLVFALTGIVRILQVKLEHDLYADPDPSKALDDLHENMPDWRRRLRVGVAGYVIFWIAAWVVGVARFLSLYGYL